MDVAHVARIALSHEGVRQKGTADRPAWYVDDRLVVRWLDPTSVVVRSDFGAREDLLVRHPGTFTVPPRFESHMMVVVELADADPAALAEAIRAAVALQRRRRRP